MSRRPIRRRRTLVSIAAGLTLLGSIAVIGTAHARVSISVDSKTLTDLLSTMVQSSFRVDLTAGSDVVSFEASGEHTLRGLPGEWFLYRAVV